jgi:RNA polymerase sigma factor (sigma-70 family)
VTHDEKAAIVKQEARRFARENRGYRVADFEDYRQEAWLGLLTALPKMELRPDIVNLGGAIRLAVRNHLREVRRRDRSVWAVNASANPKVAFAYESATLGRPDRRASGFDLLPWLINRLRALDPRAADAFEMQYGRGLTVAEIAERIGKSYRTVNRAIAAAWRFLPKIVDDIPAPGNWELPNVEPTNHSGQPDRSVSAGVVAPPAERAGARRPEGRDRSPAGLAIARRARRTHPRPLIHEVA